MHTSAVNVRSSDDKVRVIEITFKPGDAGASVARPFRISRALKGGALTRIYPDGKTEKVTYKTGDVRVSEAETTPFIPKNEGETDIVLYVVFMKEPKNDIAKLAGGSKKLDVPPDSLCPNPSNPSAEGFLLFAPRCPVACLNDCNACALRKGSAFQWEQAPPGNQ